MFRKKLTNLVILIIFLIFPISAFCQSPYYGFNKDHFERLLLTKSCPGCHLYYAKLSNLDLTGANLRGAYLIGASIRSATLRNANLKGAKVGGANFSGTDLSGAIWTDGRTCAEGSVGYCKGQQ